MHDSSGMSESGEHDAHETGGGGRPGWRGRFRRQTPGAGGGQPGAPARGWVARVGWLLLVVAVVLGIVVPVGQLLVLVPISWSHPLLRVLAVQGIVIVVGNLRDLLRVSPAASAARVPRSWRRYGCGGVVVTARAGGPGGSSRWVRPAAVAT